MKTQRAIQSKNTSRILKAVLPESFRIVNDKSSNGYKFINLLYGVEVDEVRERLKDLYNNTSLEFMEYDDNIIYESYLSGIPHSGVLNAGISGIPIYIVDYDEFHNGDPTRLKHIENISISGISFVNGLEYFRDNNRLSGYYLINSDIDQLSGYIDNIFPNNKVILTSTGIIASGFYDGIKDHNFNTKGYYELLEPMDYNSLLSKYPLYRKILDDNENEVFIDHYEPYYGWIYDHNNNIVADTSSYNGDYYFDENGNKIYYRTAYNNPYGYNNYSSVYIDLEYIPISGTLHVFDVDLLDADGNAIEIPMSGIDLYYKKSDNTFNPIYTGYDEYVPDDIQFGSIAGLKADKISTITWDYVTEGSGKDDVTLSWINSSGNITNKIRINNPSSRYIVEYKYKTYDKSSYISSLSTSKFIRLDSSNSIFSINNNEYKEIDFKFTNDPNLNESISGLYRSTILTMDGFNVRPNSRISKIDFNIPVEIKTDILTSYNLIQPEYLHIGYSNEFIPSMLSKREYLYKTYFDSIIDINNDTENDLYNKYTMKFISDDISIINRIPYNGRFCKNILNFNMNSEYSISQCDFIKNNIFFRISLKKDFIEDFTLLEVSDATNDMYFKVDVLSNGDIKLHSNIESDIMCTNYIFKNAFVYNKDNDIIIRYNNGSYDIYSKNHFTYFKQNEYYSEYVTLFTVDDSFVKLAKNCSLELFNFEIYYEDL